MTSLPHQIYLKLPPTLQSWAATLRGWKLRRERYGPTTDRLIEEALLQEHWTADHWQAWQETRLRYILHRAATRVPFYRDYWMQQSWSTSAPPWLELTHWPILEKETVRTQGDRLIADDRGRSDLLHDHTSGTTGTPLNVWLSKDAAMRWYALHEAYTRHWNGVTRHDRWGILGGQIIVPVRRQRPPFWVWNAALKQLYLSVYHLAPAHLDAYADAIKSHRVTYLLGYTSALHSLARHVLDRGRTDLQMKVIITNAEPVFEHQRATIEQAFGCPVRETYGASEMVGAASECSAGRLHWWSAAGIIEVLDDRARKRELAPPGHVGDFLCTGLINPDMPLIRYRIGDRGAMVDPSEQCRCGRQLPMVDRIEGRLDDCLYTTDGREIGRLDPVFKGDLPVQEAQIIQEKLGAVVVLVVPGVGFDAAAEASITERLRDRMGPIDVTIMKVNDIPRTTTGKQRLVMCVLPKDVIAQFRPAHRNPAKLSS